MTCVCPVVLRFPVRFRSRFHVCFRAQLPLRRQPSGGTPLAACISVPPPPLTSIPRWGRQLSSLLSPYAGRPAAVTLAAALVTFAFLLSARLALLAVLFGGGGSHE